MCLNGTNGLAYQCASTAPVVTVRDRRLGVRLGRRCCHEKERRGRVVCEGRGGGGVKGEGLACGGGHGHGWRWT